MGGIVEEIVASSMEPVDPLFGENRRRLDMVDRRGSPEGVYVLYIYSVSEVIAKRERMIADRSERLRSERTAKRIEPKKKSTWEYRDNGQRGQQNE